MRNKDRIITLEGALNVRELGGLPLAGGRHVKYGKLIRAGRLSNLSENDRKVLQRKWNVRTIIDLRNSQEISEHPDVFLEGADLRQINLIANEQNGISKEDYGMSMIDYLMMRASSLHADGGSKKLLEFMYGEMAKSPYSVGKIRDFFMELLMLRDGAFLWHCTSGKDRTGVTGALLLYLLGADMDTIREDYLYTNEQVRSYRENLLEMMRQHGADETLVEEIRILESVDWKYIENFFHSIKNTYGSIDKFLSSQLGLTEEDKRKLIQIYTE